MHRRGLYRIVYHFKSLRRSIKTLFILCFCSTAVYLYINTFANSMSQSKYENKTAEFVKSKPKDLHKYPKKCLPVERNFIRPNLDLRIIVLTYNRPTSLLRLLQSLNQAKYDGIKVAMEIWVDRNHDREYSAETVKVALNFVFDYGPCDIHIQNQHEGRHGQWFYSWRSYDNGSEIAVILEDNLTVSPYFYMWLKLVHSLYGQRSDVSGFALQGQQIRHNDSACCLNIKKENKVFLYTTFGNGGFSPNNKRWMEYIEWSPELKQNEAGLPGKRPMHQTFKKYNNLESLFWALEYIIYTWENKQFTLYPNFKGNKGLAVRLDDVDLNMEQKKTNYTEGLLLDWKKEYEDLPNIPVYVNTTGVILQP